MAEEEKKATKKATDKKAPAKKAVAPKKETAAKKPAAEKKAAAPKATKKAASGKTVTVTQTGSPIGRQEKQRATLIGLALNKMHRTNTLEGTAAVRGMIRKVRHLVKVEDAA